MLHELITFHLQTTYICLGIIALMMGSFLNMLIYRLPLMLQATWKNECRDILNIEYQLTEQEKINLFFPRSFCTTCKHMISAWQNIPVISYLLLKGRCKHCHQLISYQYPLIELLCLGLSLVAGYQFGFNTTLLFALVFIWLSIALCFIDLQHKILPDSLSLGLLWLGLIANTQSLFTPLPLAVFSAAGAYLALWLLIKLFYFCTGKMGMGHGDFKLFAAFGAWFGWEQLLLILMVSSLSGAVVGVGYLKITRQSRETPIPFGPFLCIAGLVSLFFGKEIIRWYVLTFISTLH